MTFSTETAAAKTTISTSTTEKIVASSSANVGQAKASIPPSDYEADLRQQYQSHWAPGEYAEWAINYLLMNKLAADCADPGMRDQLKVRALGFLFNFSNQSGMLENLHWQGSPLNEGVTHYYRTHTAVASLQSARALTEAINSAAPQSSGASSKSYMAVSSPRARRAISRQMQRPEKILGVAYVPDASVASPRGPTSPTSVLAVDGHLQEESFHMSVVHSGYAANPAKALETIIATCDQQEALRKCSANLAVRTFAEHGIEAQASEGPLVPEIHAPGWRDIGKSRTALRIESGMRASGLAPCIESVGRVTLSNIRGLEKISRRIDNLATGRAEQVLLSHLRTRIQKNLDNAATHMESPTAYINDMRLIHEDITTILAVVQPYEKNDLDLQMPSAKGIKPVYGMRNNGLNVVHAILNAGEEMSVDGSMPMVMTQANSYYEYVFALNDSSEYTKLALMRGYDIDGSLNALAKSLAGKKLDVFLGQYHDNISINPGAYGVQNLQNQVDGLLASGLTADKLTVAVDTTIGRQDSPELKALLHSLGPAIKSGKVNLVIFRSALKFDLAGMDNSSVGLMSIYNNGSSHWKKFNASIHSPEATQGPDFQLHTHIQKHSHEGINDYRSAIAAQHRSLVKLLPEEMITSKTTGDAKGALQVLFNDDPDTVFLHLRPSKALWEIGGHAGDMARTIAQVATRLGMDFISRPSFGHAHTTIAPIDSTRCRITLGLEDKTTMKMLADVFSAANDVGQLALQSADKTTTRELFGNSDAVMNAYVKAKASASASVQASSAFTRRT